MSVVNSLRNKIAKESSELKAFYQNSKPTPSEVKISTLRSKVEGQLNLSRVLNNGKDEYKVDIKIFFLTESLRVVMLISYFVNGDQKYFGTNEDKGEVFRETEKTLLENLEMDFQDLVLQ